MKHISNHIYKVRRESPALIIGKGPTFSMVYTKDLKDYLTIGINEVCSEIPLDIAIFTRIEVLRDMLPYAMRSSKAIYVPWNMIERDKQMEFDIMSVSLNDKAIAAARDKMFTFPMNYKSRKDSMTKIFNTGEVAFQIVERYAFYHENFFCGIDGGHRVSAPFEKYNRHHGRYNYSKQMVTINECLKNPDLKFTPLI